MKLEWSEIGASFLRSLVPVGVTYSAALIGIEYFSGDVIEFESPGGMAGLFIVPLFTLTHCVVPVFFYFVFVSAIAGMKKMRQLGGGSPVMLVPLLLFSGFIYLHIGLWYGIPTIALAWMTEWLTIPVAIIHVAIAQKGTRTWVFLEYGSTSFALLLFLVVFSAEELFPIGLLVALFQILLLTLVDWKGRGLWLQLAQDKK